MERTIPILRPDGPARQGLIDLMNDVGTIYAMAEIGCYTGESTQIFAERVERVLYAVDPWRDNYDLDHILAEAAPMEAIEKKFDERMKPFGDKVVKCKTPSLEAATRFKGEAPFDLVYIDANHKFKHLVDDLRAWGPLVRPGGFIAGHDFTDERWGVDVSTAVLRVLGRPDKVYQDGSWIKRIGGRIN
jgi:predicted O-methyltransferase YrrM